MPPQLALLLCIGFVLFLLRLERQQSQGVSQALWIPTLWMLCIASKPLGVWFGSTGDMDSGSPLDRGFHIAVLCSGCFVLAGRNFRWSCAVREHFWLALLLGYMLISVSWSNIPFVSFKRWVRELEAVVMAFVVLSEARPLEALECVLRRTIYILIPFSVMLIKYFPDSYGVRYEPWTGERMWVGVTLQKNSLGRLCMISAFFMIWALARRWLRRGGAVSRTQTFGEVFVLVLTIWLLKGPQGVYPATALGTLLAGLAVLSGLFWMKHRCVVPNLNILVAVLLFIVVNGISTPIGASVLTGFTSVMGRNATFTDRTKIWGGLVPEAMQRPILGSGFGGFWTTQTTEEHWDSEAHNGYLDVVLGLGIVGVVMVTMFLVSCCRKFHGALGCDYDRASLGICYLLMAALHNTTESSLHTFASQLMAVVLFLSIALAGESGFDRHTQSEEDREDAVMEPV